MPPQSQKPFNLEELIDSSLTVSARLALRSVTGLATHEDCLEEFNKYVQGPMHDAVVEDLGNVTDIPYLVSCNLFHSILLTSCSFRRAHTFLDKICRRTEVCLLAMSPWSLSFPPVAWADRPYLHALGYGSDFEYFAVQFIECLFCMLVYPAPWLAFVPAQKS